jgi:hypothetical protein
MSTTYTGQCVGGPYAGQMMAHWTKTKMFYRPMIAAFSADAPVEAVSIGEYRLNDFGQWHWWATGHVSGKHYEQ